MRRVNIKSFLCSKKIGLLLFLAGAVIVVSTPFVRNIAFYPVWPFAWREMGIVDVITLEYLSANTMDVEGVTSCPIINTPIVTIFDVDVSKMKTYPYGNTTRLRHWEHSRFLPPMTVEDKVRLLHTYLVLTEALQNARVEFFFVQGSLLGVHRHKGLIPWDDDIDITINASDWKLVRHALSCIEGFVLSVTNYMHWKFYPNATEPRLGYPFVDIFFYTGNERFLWAVSKSTSRFLVFAKKDTFPLSTGEFEGLAVPVPKNIDHVLKVRYNSFDQCQSRAMDHKTVVAFPDSEVSTVPCSSLTYLYKMYHLDST